MPTTVLEQEALTRSVIGAFYDVYNCLGYGFLEHLYLLALEQELRARGHAVTRELGVQVHFKGFPLGMQRLDMVVDSSLVIEAKSTYHLAPDARRQLHNYLRATNLEIGLLFHFGPSPKFFREISTNVPTRPARTVEAAHAETAGASTSQASAKPSVIEFAASRQLASASPGDCAWARPE